LVQFIQLVSKIYTIMCHKLLYYLLNLQKLFEMGFSCSVHNSEYCDNILKIDCISCISIKIFKAFIDFRVICIPSAIQATF